MNIVLHPVLCSYAYYSDTYAGKFTASKMIFVARPADILKEFNLVMEQDRKNWKQFYCVGPRPALWQLESYLSYCGNEKF